MADGSALDPYHVIVDGLGTGLVVETTSTVGPVVLDSSSFPLPVAVSGEVSTIETTQTVRLADVSGDWGSSIQAYMTATVLLLVLLIGVACVQVVLQVRK